MRKTEGLQFKKLQSIYLTLSRKTGLSIANERQQSRKCVVDPSCRPLVHRGLNES